MKLAGAVSAKVPRYFLCAIAVASAMAAFYSLSIRLVGQLEVLSANNRMLEGKYDEAAALLEGAVPRLPSDPAAWKSLGRAYQGMAKGKSAEEAFQFALKARNAYASAARWNPLDAEIRFGEAVQASAMERMSGLPAAYGENGPYGARACYEEALKLRPNGIQYHYGYARYLHWRKDKKRLLEVVEDLARIYPPAYDNLKREAFWSDDVRDAAEMGLEKAARDGIHPAIAHAALADLSREKGNPAAAVEHYRLSWGGGETSGGLVNDRRLAELYLQNGQKDEAVALFLNMLAKGEPSETALERIYSICIDQNAPEAFLSLLEAAGTRIRLAGKSEVLRAKALVAAGRDDEAVEVLDGLNRSRPAAEAHYLLYQIAERKKDSAAMETAISGATRLDPGNSLYRRLFASLLAKRDDLRKAEREAGKAIAYAAKADANLYALRADIRSRQGNHKGAAEDWERASSLQPNNVGFHANAASSYESVGDLIKARDKYEKTVELAPDNPDYRKKFHVLQGVLELRGKK